MLKGHSDDMLSVAFSQDGTQVVSRSDDKTVRIWDVTTGKTKGGPRFWKAATGKTERVLNGHSRGVYSVAFSRDGTRIVSGSGDNTVRLWNAVTGEMERVLEGHSARIQSVAFSPDGTHVISSSQDELVLIWDATTGESISLPYSKSFDFPDKSKVTHICPGQFQLFAVDQRVRFLSRDRKWILTDQPSGACWIPPECRDYWSHAISGSKVCLGCRSGRVIIADLLP